MSRFKRYDPSDIHWLLIEATKVMQRIDKAVEDDGWVSVQALFCPYYAALEGYLGSDWGVILNPESAKFAQLVFEHHWCGCPIEEDGHGGVRAVHGGGSQAIDEWAVPPSRRRINRRIKRWEAKRQAEQAGA